jgi:glutathione synthase/RimK-type ligase-like ATP-grasp enzyme
VDVALVTCLELPEPDPDAAPLARALRDAGISAELRAWDDPAVDWSEARLTVLRSSWNYPRRHRAFLRWAARAAAVSELWNPLPVVRWNTHKGYLLELARHGVPVAPTVLLERGSSATLDSVRREQGWDEVVVKPAVSAASFKTRRATPGRGDGGEAHLQELLAERDVLVQRYLDSVEDHGERALVLVDGALTHAVRKSPRFEGQSESVSACAVNVSGAEAALARRALAVVPAPLLYARVDLAPGAGGEPLLMELELVEPSLFFAQSKAALARFVAGLRRRLDASPADRLSARAPA